VKPDIVFFGENLPAKFFEEAEISCLLADLLICVGTSLEVYPFAGRLPVLWAAFVLCCPESAFI
jgi:NAD-dependent SIR2 family protein deacetylase